MHDKLELDTAKSCDKRIEQIEEQWKQANEGFTK